MLKSIAPPNSAPDKLATPNGIKKNIDPQVITATIFIARFLI